MRTPSGLEDWQARAFIEAAEAWEELYGEREEPEPGRTRALHDTRGGDDEPRIDIPYVGSPQTRWVRLAEQRTISGRHIVPLCGTPIGRGELKGHRCPRPAGQGTVHLGAGSCVAHGGAKRHGRALGAWLMAHAFGQELDVTPWEGLLTAVRIAAGKSAYCEWVLSQATSDLELEGRFGRNEDGILLHPDTGEMLGAGEFRDLSFWVAQSTLWHDRLAKTSKMAIDAGVARWQIEKAESEANAIARVLNDVIEGMDGVLSEAQAVQMRTLMRNSLLALDREHSQREIAPSTNADAGVVDSTYREEGI